MSLKRYCVITLAAVVMVSAAISLAKQLGQDHNMEFSVNTDVYKKDGKTRKLHSDSDSMPIRDNATGDLLLPLRLVMEEMGGQVEWDEEEKSTVVTNRGTVMKVKAGDKNAVVNGSSIMLNKAPENIQGSLYMPAASITENFGTQIEWDGETNTITLHSDRIKKPIVNQNLLSYEDNDVAYSIALPVISELNDLHFQKDLNRQLMEKYMNEIRMFALSSKLETDPNTKFIWDAKLKVYNRTSELISFALEGKKSEPSKFNQSYVQAFTINLETQEFVFLGDIFKNDRYKKVIVNTINDMIQKEPALYSVSGVENYNEKFEQQFCISEAGVIIFVESDGKGGEYNIFEVPFQQLKRHLKTNYTFLKK